MQGRTVKSELLTVVEAEAMTGVSKWSWRKWAYAGVVSSVKLGSRLLIPVSEIDRLIARARARHWSARDGQPNTRAGAVKVSQDGVAEPR
jgi:hypothetical protein